MNYSFQLRGIPNANRLDYSRSDLPDLIENDDPTNPSDGLNESTRHPGRNGHYALLLPRIYQHDHGRWNRDDQLGLRHAEP
jgi:hypothetical protein